MVDARRDLAERQAAEGRQMQLAGQRIGLQQQLNKNRSMSAERLQAAQPISPLSQPNFRAAAQLLSGMVNVNPK